MLYHYALLPDVFRPERLAKSADARTTLRVLLRELCDSGLIADLHEDSWSRHILADLLPNLPEQVKGDVQECLKRLKDRKRLITCAPYSNGMPQKREDWLDAAIEVFDDHRFEAIIGTPAYLDEYGSPHPAFIEMSSVLHSTPWIDHTHDRTVARTRLDFLAALTPILRYSATLILIDPYMTCHERRFLEVVKTYAEVLGTGRYRPKLRRIITIHAGDPWTTGNERWRESPADRLNAWEQELRPLVETDSGLEFRVLLWTDTSRADRFHDRFIITDQCCLSVPGGLDIGDGKTTLDVKSHSVHQEQLDRFKDAKTSFQRLGEPRIVKQSLK